jgi:homocysteine S-methyltransferase
MIETAHAEQAAILAGRGADLLILETFFRVDELAIAVKAARSVTDLPLIGMMTFAHERPPHPYREQAEMVDELAELDLLAIGVNCAPGPMGAIEILRHVTETKLPLAASPNAGMPVQREGRILMAPATPSYLARFTRQAVGLGVAYIGGCCGTGAEHIRAIAEAARDLKPEPRTGTPAVAPESVRPRRSRPSSSVANLYVWCSSTRRRGLTSKPSWTPLRPSAPTQMSTRSTSTPTPSPACAWTRSSSASSSSSGRASRPFLTSPRAMPA